MNATRPDGKNAAAALPAENHHRRSLLDLAPLELDCMNTLWPIGEGTVREIRDRLASRRPRAYTTIMTIMDRLARKGIVERRKSGRAYVYRPNLTVRDAQGQAVAQVIEGFFAGSKDALLSHLGAAPPVEAQGAAEHPTMAAMSDAASSAPNNPLRGNSAAAVPLPAPRGAGA